MGRSSPPPRPAFAVLPRTPLPERRSGAPVAGRDEEGDVLTYTPSGADAAFFDVDRTSGQHLTKARLDYESRNSYSVMLTVSDPTNASDAITVVVNITNNGERGHDNPVHTAALRRR